MIHYTHLKESPAPVLSAMLDTHHAQFSVVARPDTKYGRAISVVPSDDANAASEVAVHINAGDDAFYVATAIAHVHRHNLDIQHAALLEAYQIVIIADRQKSLQNQIDADGLPNEPTQ